MANTVHQSAVGGPKTRDVCITCGGETHFSHRQYAGSGRTVAVYRCLTCGAVTTGTPMLQSESSKDARARTGRSRKHAGYDEGPPGNPVLDPETARRLLEEAPPDA